MTTDSAEYIKRAHDLVNEAGDAATQGVIEAANVALQGAQVMALLAVATTIKETLG